MTQLAATEVFTELNETAERSKFVSVIERTDNTSAASVPLALDAAVSDGRVRPGDAILLMGFGGGLSWASTVAIWG